MTNTIAICRAVATVHWSESCGTPFSWTQWAGIFLSVYGLIKALMLPLQLLDNILFHAVIGSQKFWDGQSFDICGKNEKCIFGVIRLIALPMLRGTASTVSRRKQIINDRMMVRCMKNVICKFNCLMLNVPTTQSFNIVLKWLLARFLRARN